MGTISPTSLLCSFIFLSYIKLSLHRIFSQMWSAPLHSLLGRVHALGDLFLKKRNLWIRKAWGSLGNDVLSDKLQWSFQPATRVFPLTGLGKPAPRVWCGLVIWSLRGVQMILTQWIWSVKTDFPSATLGWWCRSLGNLGSMQRPWVFVCL